MEDYKISIKEENYKKGLAYGNINDLEWVAIINKEEDIHGINPESLRAGSGRIIKLCVYKDVVEEEGDPFKLVFKTSRYIYAEYNKKWEVLNVKYYQTIYRLVNYLEKRYSLKIIHGKEES